MVPAGRGTNGEAGTLVVRLLRRGYGLQVGRVSTTPAANDLIFMNLRVYQKRSSHDVPHNVGKALAASGEALPM